ncbi:MAG TPA: phosphonoacetate hydrolase, partial [Alphaproteobacteria bacterium]|nr:phosphonoacetate hydrolase [Alphaproteobacteria bacterium]
MIHVNGIDFRHPERTVVVVCIDGSDPAYHDRGLADGILPNMARFAETGFAALADGVVPSFTNPNNLSIVTAAPPAVHGIAGNFFLDPETGAEVMMNDPAFLRAESLLAAFSRDGAQVVVITAKDKLRRLLGHGIEDGICFSSEMAGGCTMDENGIEGVLDLVGAPEPDVYSAELSLFVMEAGIRILERDRPTIMYLSLTDYIQHKYAPGSPESDTFYKALDDAVGRLADLGAVVGLTADHGMNDKSAADGSPNVVYLQSVLDEAIGIGQARVILPITDPYVVHHGALGGYARVHCTGAAPEAIMETVRALPGIEAVFDRAGAAATFSLPPDIEGDVAVIADAATVIGTSEE